MLKKLNVSCHLSSPFYKFGVMKLQYIYMALFMALLFGCAENEEQKAAPLLSTIESLNRQGRYREALDSIMKLRENHPKAIEARKRALVIWQEASLKMAQEDVGKTDAELQVVLQKIEQEKDLYKANMLRVKRDSLQARYEAMCGVVRMIRMRQEAN